MSSLRSSLPSLSASNDIARSTNCSGEGGPRRSPPGPPGGPPSGGCAIATALLNRVTATTPQIRIRLMGSSSEEIAVFPSNGSPAGKLLASRRS
jgi:hypothetical protein